jgi:hypothetical protein
VTIKAQETPRVLSLSEAADRLHMKRSNVAKFLARRGVRPAFSKAQGYFWWESDIDRVKAEREADEARMAADEKRRQAAIHGGQHREPVPSEISRLGRTQRDLLTTMLRRPVVASSDAERLALRRLVQRGLAERIDGEGGSHRLTDTARSLVAARL